MHILRYFFAALIATSAAVAQLPPFRFVGLPERHSPTSQTILMNDRILIHSDDETSTWDQRRQRHYIYHRSTGKWSPLPNLDTARTKGSIMVLNDSLILVDQYSNEFVIWNVDTDALMLSCIPTSHSSYGIVIHPKFGCVQIDQKQDDRSKLTVTVTSLIDGTVDVLNTMPPNVNDYVSSIVANDPGGFWVLTSETLWWTEGFDTYTKIMDLGPRDRYEYGIDGKSVHVMRRAVSGGRDSLFTFTSPGRSPVITTTPRNFTDMINGMVDSKFRVWTYQGGANDGFYVAPNDTSEPVLISRFDERRKLIRCYLGPDAWVIAHTFTGLMVSEDEGASWKQIPLPHRTYIQIDSLSTLQYVEDGGVMLNATAYNLYYVSGDESNFRVINGDASVGRPTYWYHRNGSLMSCDFLNRAWLSDQRGLVDFSARYTRVYGAFSYRDTVYLRWYESSVGLSIGPWIPNSTTIRSDPSARNRFEKVRVVRDLANGSSWYGGVGSEWSFSPTGNVEDIQTVTMASPLCQSSASIVSTSVIADSLVVLIDQSFCRAVLALPTSDLSTYVIRKRSLPYGYPGKLIEGNEQQRIGLWSDPLSPDYIKDSVYILDAEMMSAKVRRFENITETRVFDITYDKVNRVYYALTARGLYRSDPVVSSVSSDDSASDVPRPTSGVPLQTAWYNTLGEHVSPPTTPGLYLKITMDDKGQMVTEKVAIP